MEINIHFYIPFNEHLDYAEKGHILVQTCLGRIADLEMKLLRGDKAFMNC
jgi:hypothetical protein